MQQLRTAVAGLIAVALAATASVAGTVDSSAWRERQVASAASYADETPDIGPASPCQTDPTGPSR